MDERNLQFTFQQYLDAILTSGLIARRTARKENRQAMLLFSKANQYFLSDKLSNADRSLRSPQVAYRHDL